MRGPSVMLKQHSIPIESTEEIEAILLGLCWIEQQEDSEYLDCAAALIERIAASLPEPGSYSKSQRRGIGSLVADVKWAVQNELQLRIAYQDRKGVATKRTIWPIEFYPDGRNDGVVLAWCEARGGFRNFRTERVQSLDTLDRYPVRRQLLLARWHLEQGDSFY